MLNTTFRPVDEMLQTMWTADSWAEFEPYYDELRNRPLIAQNVDEWLKDWSFIDDLLSEIISRLHVANTCNTADQDVEQRYRACLEHILPKSISAGNKLQRKLLDSGLEPANFEVPLRNIRAEVELFREVNLPLQVEERNLGIQFSKILSTQTVIWEGKESTIVALNPVFQDPDRSKREQAWRLSMERQLADRAVINQLWTQFLSLRRKIAANAGKPDYRAYAWQSKLRFDYTPEDCLLFHQAVEDVVVPAASTLHERQRQRLGVETLRPWDTNVDPSGLPALRPFESIAEFEADTAAVFQKLDPQLAGYFDTMRDEDLLDLDNRKNKGPGGYCTGFPVAKRPFIFMNAVGVHGDVRTLVHEAGHAFHGFEKFDLPYEMQRVVTAEFNEVASMAMELLTLPFWTEYYSEQDYARACVDHLEKIIHFWPYMAVVDAFQHWVYTHPDAADDPTNCDAAWADLWRRFIPGEDWSGFEDAMMTGWHRKHHIFRYPFYYVEYGMAQLGAVQVWANMLRDQPKALKAYRDSLALGGTKTLPELFATAGARFVFNHQTMREGVDLLMRTIDELESKAG
jgi:oligoendopeptidase F